MNKPQWYESKGYGEGQYTDYPYVMLGAGTGQGLREGSYGVVGSDAYNHFNEYREKKLKKECIISDSIPLLIFLFDLEMEQ